MMTERMVVYLEMFAVLCELAVARQDELELLPEFVEYVIDLCRGKK